MFSLSGDFVVSLAGMKLESLTINSCSCRVDISGSSLKILNVRFTDWSCLVVDENTFVADLAESKVNGLGPMDEHQKALVQPQ